jgi:putative FmdB family regulatory protein
MPTYAYRGDQCGHEFEIRQSFAEDPITECPDCGMPVHRVIHPAGIVFKGTGWYITDSRPTNDTSGGIQDASKATEKKADSSAPADSTAAPAAKAEPAVATAGAADAASGGKG